MMHAINTQSTHAQSTYGPTNCMYCLGMIKDEDGSTLRCTHHHHHPHIVRRVDYSYSAVVTQCGALASVGTRCSLYGYNVRMHDRRPATNQHVLRTDDVQPRGRTGC